MLFAIFVQGCIHCTLVNNIRISVDPMRIFLLPVLALVLTLLIGYPLIVNLAVSCCVRQSVSNILLLSVAVIYGMLWILFFTNSNCYGDPKKITGLAFLLGPIWFTMVVLLPLWLLTIGLEIYFRIVHSRTAQRSVPDALESETASPTDAGRDTM